MLHLFRSIGMAALAGMAFQVSASDANSARQASEITPTESQRGETASRGPRKFGSTDGEETTTEVKKEEKNEKKEKNQKKHDHKHEDGEHHHDHKHDDKHEHKDLKSEKSSSNTQCESCGKVAEGCACPSGDACTTCAVNTIPLQPKTEMAKADFDRKMRSAIRKLSTSGWREAQVELVDGGKSAIPYLIDAMAVKDEEGARAPAYNLGAHTKSDAGRAPRQRSVAEVVAELLTSIVSNNSNFKGELPAVDQKAWQEWWIANGESVTFSK